METGDPRYLHLNTGMWIGSGIRRGTEGWSSSQIYEYMLTRCSDLRCLPCHLSQRSTYEDNLMRMERN